MGKACRGPRTCVPPMDDLCGRRWAASFSHSLFFAVQEPKLYRYWVNIQTCICTMYHVQRNPNHSKGEKLTDSDPSQNDSAWSRLVLPGHEPDTIGPTEPVGLYEDFVLRSNTLSVYSWCTIIADRLAGKGEKNFRLANMRDPLAPGVPVVFLTASHMTVQGTETAYIYIVHTSSVVSSSIVNCQYIIT